MRLDAHQHFWRFNAAEYPWIEREWPVRRDFLPEDLLPLLNQCAIEGCIAVQARQTTEETRWLLELAEQHSFIKGVVGWVDLRSEGVEKDLRQLAQNRKFVGVRHVVQDEPDDRFMLRSDFMRGIGRLKQFNLTYDLLITPRQLSATIEFVKHFPDQPFVIDHLAKPEIKQGILSPWREQLFEVAKQSNVMCKISGMVTEADWKTWKPHDFRPYVEVILEAFGPKRLMYGSDWPVCLLAGTYDQIFNAANECLSLTSGLARPGILGENAAAFYLGT